MGLTEEEKATLLKRARLAIKLSLTAKDRMPALLAEEAPTGTLTEERGLFVTLTSGGRLRGCIGFIEPAGPLWKVICDAAQSAAFRDSRFAPVTENELPEITLDVSVLTPLEPIENPEDVVIGTHGVYINRGWASGLLLPQVATEHGMDRDEFLSHTCLKARLPEDTWRKGMDGFNRFSADVFGEDDFPTP